MVVACPHVAAHPCTGLSVTHTVSRAVTDGQPRIRHPLVGAHKALSTGPNTTENNRDNVNRFG